MGRLVLNSRGLNTKIGCKQISKKISDDDIFILQHITVNNDECESIKKYGILNRKDLLKHD